LSVFTQHLSDGQILACGANFPGEAKRDVFLQMTLKTKISGALFRKTPHAFERKLIEINNI